MRADERIARNSFVVPGRRRTRILRDLRPDSCNALAVHTATTPPAMVGWILCRLSEKSAVGESVADDVMQGTSASTLTASGPHQHGDGQETMMGGTAV
jgi:hypothetical protein